ncbi:MAG: TIGR03016 family PEP-CTERM system-associated outer membrane protein [Halioglobus sp.]|nr:TIGR03016 family PEP-CTERM system-associated outer membrane protein [Halioglobus sp.]
MPTRPRPVSYRCLAVAVFCLGFGANANAAKYDASLAVSPSVTFTDNICAREGDKKSDFVGTATPSGRLSAKGRRASVNLTGHIQVNTLTNSQLRERGCGDVQSNPKRQQYKPKLRANGSVDVIRNALRVNFGVRADQNKVNSRFSGDEDPFDRTGNGNNYIRYNIAPNYSRRLQNIGMLNLRYSYDELINEQNKGNDSVRQQVNVGLNGAGNSRFSWGVTARHSEVEYKKPEESVNPRRDSELQSARLNLGYQWRRILGFNGNIGRDWNNLRNNRFGNDDLAWQLNLRWTPTRRTSVTLGSGDRFFGKTPRVQIKHKSNRGAFTLGYNKKITFDRDLRTSDDGLLEDFGNNDTLDSRSPLIDERISLSYNHQGGSSNITIAGHFSEQTRTEDNQQGTFKNLGITYSPRIASNYSLSFLLNWSENEPRQRTGVIDAPDNASQVWTGSVTLSKPINNRLSSAFTYQYLDRTSDQNLGDYQENRIVATLSISL